MLAEVARDQQLVVRPQLVRVPLQHDLSVGEDVAPVGDRKRGSRGREVKPSIGKPQRGAVNRLREQAEHKARSETEKIHRVRENALAQYRQWELKDYSLGDLRTELNGSTIIVTYAISLVGTEGSQPLPAAPLHMMSVWQQQKAGWIMIAHSVSQP